MSELNMSRQIKEIRKRYGAKEIVINSIGPVIGAHTGPGCVALFFTGRHR